MVVDIMGNLEGFIFYSSLNIVTSIHVKWNKYKPKKLKQEMTCQTFCNRYTCHGSSEMTSNRMSRVTESVARSRILLTALWPRVPSKVSSTKLLTFLIIHIDKLNNNFKIITQLTFTMFHY